MTKKELEEIRRRHKPKPKPRGTVYAPSGDVLGVIIYDSNPFGETGDIDVTVENISNRDNDVHRLLEAVDEMQWMIKRLVNVAEGIGPNEYGVYPLVVDVEVIQRLKEMAGNGR